MIALISESVNSFLDNSDHCGLMILPSSEVETPFGLASYYTCEVDDKSFLYFPNSGTNQHLDNVNAPLAIFHILRQEGVQRVVMIGKVGGVNPLLNVGDLLIPDDYIDFTSIRKRSYWQALDSSLSLHYVMENPLCTTLREMLYKVICSAREKYGAVVNNILTRGRYFCTEGPGFESAAEITAFRSLGADVVGHTLTPSVYYARELGICLNAICVVSNIAIAYHETVKVEPLPHSVETENLLSYLFLETVRLTPHDKTCNCQTGEDYWLRKPIQRQT